MIASAGHRKRRLQPRGGVHRIERDPRARPGPQPIQSLFSPFRRPAVEEGRRERDLLRLPQVAPAIQRQIEPGREQRLRSSP